MAKPSQILWGIHAGKTGDADQLFLRHNVIALGWVDAGDLSKLPADREAFKTRVKECYPNRKEGYFPVAGGQLFRFVHEAKVGDYVLYPSKQDRSVHIAEITGSFKYDPKTMPGYPQHRPVKWLKAVPRTHFSQGALYEIGSALSFFQVRQFADEFLSALTGHPDWNHMRQCELNPIKLLNTSLPKVFGICYKLLTFNKLLKDCPNVYRLINMAQRT